MDIHQPEHPVRSVRDFAFHIFTVTIGILIALGLEALVEAHRGRLLAAHARADFREEFRHNRAALLADEGKLQATQHELEGLIGYGRSRLAHKDAKVVDIAAARSFAFATATAWDTAVATQALLHLSFMETGAITAAVSAQSAFNALQNRAEAQWFELAAFGDPRAIADDQVAPALQKVTIAYAYASSVLAFEKTLIGTYDQALSALAP